MNILLKFLYTSTAMTYHYISSSEDFNVYNAIETIRKGKLGAITNLNTNIESYKIFIKAMSPFKDIFTNKIEGAKEFFTKVDHLLSSIEDSKDSLWIMEKCLKLEFNLGVEEIIRVANSYLLNSNIYTALFEVINKGATIYYVKTEIEPATDFTIKTLGEELNSILGLNHDNHTLTEIF